MQKCETEFRYQVSFQIIRSFLLQFHGKVSLQIRIYCVNDFSDGNFFLPNRLHYGRIFKILAKNYKASFFQLKSEVTHWLWQEESHFVVEISFILYRYYLDSCWFRRKNGFIIFGQYMKIPAIVAQLYFS